MNRNDWYETGDQIKKIVQDAVDSRDFTELGNTIADVVNQTVNGLQAVLNETLNARNRQNWDQDARQGTDGKYQDAAHRGADWYQKTNREAAERIRRSMQDKEKRKKENSEAFTRESFVKKRPEYKAVKAELKVQGEISGRIMKWTGYSMSSMFGLSLAIIGVIGAATGVSMMIPAGILGILLGASLIIGINGRQKVVLAKRFRKYYEVLGERTYCLVEELASAIGQSCKYVQKDLKKMIRRGYFKEGYLDRKETLLITDRATYQQYLTTQTEYERREMRKDVKAEGTSAKAEAASGVEKQKEAEKASDRWQKKEMSLECCELIAEGQHYIQHVHECNIKIPNEEMSEKLNRLELVITRIFREAEKNPDVVSDLKKMMSYYLPTTRKLLDAYCELDEQPIRGQNIENTKKEIEVALDTINEAFEKLLDDLFEETAWDISSDISVLQTMLKQEGLTGKDFV